MQNMYSFFIQNLLNLRQFWFSNKKRLPVPTTAHSFRRRFVLALNNEHWQSRDRALFTENCTERGYLEPVAQHRREPQRAGQAVVHNDFQRGGARGHFDFSGDLGRFD